ncbi:MAG: LytR C-terminal domain-containing protein [Candidatus Levybacteria bacterium]|nr:LytR C-terminal domain-containing protein [Candidatus Levybacteria bacterium]
MEEQTIPDLASGAQQYRYQHQGGEAKNPKRFIILVIFALIFIGAVFGVTKFMGVGKEQEVVPSPTPTEILFPTDTPEPTASPPAGGSPTPAATKTPTPPPAGGPTTNPVDKATGLDRSLLSVEVQNGSGKAGAASAVSDLLKGLGYKVTSVGNADSFDYENTVIQVASGKSTYLDLLKKDLSVSYTIGTASATLTASTSADAVVIVGKE